MLKKAMISLIILLIGISLAIVLDTPTKDDSYPKDYSEEEYFQMRKENIKLIQDTLLASNKPTYAEASEYYFKLAPTLKFKPTTTSIKDEVAVLFAKKQYNYNLTLKNIKDFTLKEHYIGFKARRFIKKNYPNTCKTGAKEQTWLIEFYEEYRKHGKRKRYPMDPPPFTYKDGTVIGYGAGVPYIIKEGSSLSDTN